MSISSSQVDDYLTRYAATLTELDAEAGDAAEKLQALAEERGVEIPRS